MNTTRESDELVQLAAQGGEHVARLRALLQGGPPDVADLKAAVAATRALRGSAASGVSEAS